MVTDDDDDTENEGAELMRQAVAKKYKVHKLIPERMLSKLRLMVLRQLRKTSSFKHQFDKFVQTHLNPTKESRRDRQGGVMAGGKRGAGRPPPADEPKDR